MKQMTTLMQRLRTAAPTTISGVAIARCEDYLSPSNTDLPQSDVLRFWLADGSKLVIRPSGTEPKVKIYAEVTAPCKGDLDKQIGDLDQKLARMVSAIQREIGI